VFQKPEGADMDDSNTLTAELRKKIISQITQARVDKGLTQSQLARLLNTQRSNISRLESGEHNPTLDFLLRVTALLDIKLDIITQKPQASAVLDNVYDLRQYDTPLMSFTLQSRGIEGLTADIVSLNESQSKLYPLDLTLTGEGVVEWLRHRVIPKNRAFIAEILRSLDLSEGDVKGIIDVCKGLSLNDSYWVTPQGFDGSFSKYNLYENPFSKILSLVAYTGVWQYHRAFTTSPELTTTGMLPKAWRLIEGDGIYLYKGGTSGAANTGQEPYSEFYACQIAQKMGLNAISYDLKKWKGILASTWLWMMI